ncbi:MAG TPA: SCO family protein, partial [Microthrixaceae bacterium]|nr:SCO family protein [Microthrixaceae bacterium]HNH39105.1 SCO family protein [Microthrixaceae bacterium]HNO45496.1 SCO family protein [Microthrixaceae bacterium]
LVIHLWFDISMSDNFRQRRRVRTGRIVALLVALTLVGAACGSDTTDDDASGSGDLLGAVRNPPLAVGDVTLTDTSGATPRSVTMTPPKGDLYVVYFGYASCPDICPTTLSDIQVALGDLDEADAKRVTVGMVTVDPERDTPELLSEYLSHFFDRSMALRAETPEALTAATEAFGVRYEIAPHPPGATDYEVSHTAVTYVIDDTGKVAVEWPFGFDSEHMTKDLNTLLEG